MPAPSQGDFYLGGGTPTALLPFFPKCDVYCCWGFVLFFLEKIAYSTPTLSPTSPQAGIQTRKWGRLEREGAWVGSPGVGSGNC